MPGLVQQAINFGKAFVQHVATGAQAASAELVAERLALCSACPHLTADRRCAHIKCGCWVDAKVKGRAAVGEIALSSNEYKTAERLKKDFWLYVVFNCGSKPEIHIVQDPVRLGWEPIVQIEHYHVGAGKIIQGTK